MILLRAMEVLNSFDIKAKKAIIKVNLCDARLPEIVR